MSFRSGLFVGIAVTLLFCGVGTAAWWIVSTPKPASKSNKPEPAATVEKKIKEDELNLITLTPKAEECLKVKTAPVERKRVPRARPYGGEVVVPVGKTTVVSAPLSGLLKVPQEGLPLPGRMVKKGQPIFQLMPLLAPDARANLATACVDAGGQVDAARVQLEAAEILLNRNKVLVSQDAGSQRAVDEAKIQYNAAQKALNAAQSRLDLLTKITGELDKGTAAPLPIDAPEDGLLRNLSAQPGQNVPSGATLFEIVDLARVWIRVPVFVGDVPDIAQGRPADIGSLTGKPGESTRAAQPVNAPPSANPQAGTLDLYYELDNPAGEPGKGLLPGQRVGVTVPLQTTEESLVVPWSAVIHDINGGTWVYEQRGERQYARRRVVVRHVIGDEAVLQMQDQEKGLKAGAQVVSLGAAEMYGVETGFSK